jgi:hypothetical protein
MSENVQAKCSRCERGIKGKVYHPEYICADCKIEILEYKVEDKVRDMARLEEEAQYYKEIAKKGIGYENYKVAFETLVKELKESK